MKNELEFGSKATTDLQDVSPFDIKSILRAFDDVEKDIMEMNRLYYSYVNDHPFDDDDQINLENFKVGKLLEHILWLAECVSDLTA